MRINILVLLLISWGAMQSCHPTININCPIRDDQFESVSLRIPKYLKREYSYASTEPPVEYVFRYRDSSILYMTTEPGGSAINFDNISLYDSLYKRRSQVDSLTMQGEDQQHSYWKDKKLNAKLFIGYLNVSSHKRARFDKAINSCTLIGRK